MSKITEITVNVSKKIGNANFGSDMVSASITISLESDSEVSEAYKQGWAIVHEEVEKQESALNESKSIADSIKQSTNFVEDISAELAEPEEKMCELHTKPMKRREGKFGPFYSHGIKLEDGSFQWCSGKGYGKK